MAATVSRWCRPTGGSEICRLLQLTTTGSPSVGGQYDHQLTRRESWRSALNQTRLMFQKYGPVASITPVRLLRYAVRIWNCTAVCRALSRTHAGGFPGPSRRAPPGRRSHEAAKQRLHRVVLGPTELCGGTQAADLAVLDRSEANRRGRPGVQVGQPLFSTGSRDSADACCTLV